jgi:hypothetical protein
MSHAVDQKDIWMVTKELFVDGVPINLEYTSVPFQHLLRPTLIAGKFGETDHLNTV